TIAALPPPSEHDYEHQPRCLVSPPPAGSTRLDTPPPHAEALPSKLFDCRRPYRGLGHCCAATNVVSCSWTRVHGTRLSSTASDFVLLILIINNKFSTGSYHYLLRFLTPLHPWRLAADPTSRRYEDSLSHAPQLVPAHIHHIPSIPFDRGRPQEVPGHHHDVRGLMYTVPRA
ncbi:hypothetical protein C0995_001952, partial [Termitomyces sp. Mi166